MTIAERPQQRRRGRRGFLAALGAVTLLGTTALGTAAAGTTGDPAKDRAQQQASRSAAPEPGEVVTSPNVTHLANLPIPDVFNGAIGSDLAFKDGMAYIGSYAGFWVVDITNPVEPEVVVEVLCPGGQGDVTIEGDLLFLSVDAPRTDDSCNSGASNAANPDAWEGVRIFDISDLSNPEYVAAVRTDCGSHTHTNVPSPDGESLFIYVSSYGPNANFPNCQPPHDSISIIEVPLDSPQDAEVVAVPDLFADDNGGNPGGNGSSTTSGCHDITVLPSKNLAAGACMGDGILMDISDPAAPVVLERVRDTTNFAFWHSATFNLATNKVVFTDELGGGGGATCLPTISADKGANAIYALGEDLSLTHENYFKIPRDQTTTENCVAHNGSLIPVNGKDIMVQAWYQGGVSIWDFTDSANPQELGFFERGPISADQLVLGGSWSAYYYNGYIYSSDITEGLDVLVIKDSRVNNGSKTREGTLNVQTQPDYFG